MGYPRLILSNQKKESISIYTKGEPFVYWKPLNGYFDKWCKTSTICLDENNLQQLNYIII